MLMAWDEMVVLEVGFVLFDTREMEKKETGLEFWLQLWVLWNYDLVWQTIFIDFDWVKEAGI
jgi:hypothetical protein